MTRGDFVLRPAQRVRKSREFARAQRGARRAHAPHFVLLASRRGDELPARLGLIAPRAAGTAVRRTRAKRLVREWFRHAELPPGVDVLVVVLTGAAELAASAAAAELAGCATRLFGRRPRG
ncbi:MAG: ribonuclease P protein component [Polyangiaceae bacterium]|nr:ribonuclease P protein component [Polyangiaceae bacterium]